MPRNISMEWLYYEKDKYNTFNWLSYVKKSTQEKEKKDLRKKKKKT